MSRGLVLGEFGYCKPDEPDPIVVPRFPGLFVFIDWNQPVPVLLVSMRESTFP